MQKIYLDFETYYDSKYSLTKMTTAEYVNDERFLVWGVGVKLDDSETVWIENSECQDFFNQIDWSQSALVCHNTLFDAYILTQIYNIKPKFYYDTASMSRGLFPNQSAKLKHVAERLFPNDETMRKGDELINAKGIVDLPPDIEASIAGYCIQDVDLTYAIFQKMLTSYPQSELELINLTTKMFVEPKLILNKELLTTYKEELKINNETLINNSGVAKDVLSSNQKFTAHLLDLNVNPPMKRSPRTGLMIPALGKNDSGYIQMCKAYPELQHLWAAREACKSRLEETRADRFIKSVNKNGTFSVPLRYYSAHTGRFGGSDKINLQNLPRGSKLRTALQAPTGHLLYVADLSNIEARMLAWLAQQEDLLTSFAAGNDVYSEFASSIYNRPISKKDKLERYVGKTAILGLGYGMGSNKFKLTLETGNPPVTITDNTAAQIVNHYRCTYPNIPVLWNGCKQMLFGMLGSKSYDYGPLTVERNALLLPNGMRLKYPNLRHISNEFTYKSGDVITRMYGPRLTENIVQALARIVITDQILEIDKLENVNIVLQVHDEIIAVSKNTNPDETMDKILSIMKTPPSWCSNLPLDAEGAFSEVYNK